MQVLHVREFPQAGRLRVGQLHAERLQPPRDRVDDVAVLAQILLAAQQARRQRRVLARPRAAPGRAGQRLGLDHALAHAHQPLRRRPDEARPRPARRREGIALGETLAQAVQHRERMQRPAGGQIDGAREHDLLKLARRDALQPALHHRAVVARLVLAKLERPGLRRRGRRRVLETRELAVRAPHPSRQRVEIAARLHHDVGHRRRHLAGARHLPARHENLRRRERLARLDLVLKREAREKMRPAEGRVHVAHRDGARQRRVDEAPHRRETIRPRRRGPQRHLRARDGHADRRPLRVEMRLRRIEDRLQHRERIQRRHHERDAREHRLAVRRRLGLAPGQERPQGLRRGVFGGLDRQDGHGEVKTSPEARARSPPLAMKPNKFPPASAVPRQRLFLSAEAIGREIDLPRRQRRPLKSKRRPLARRISGAPRFYPGLSIHRRARPYSLSGPVSGSVITSPARARSTQRLMRTSPSWRFGASAFMVPRRLITVAA